jgi:hypothetical protein
MSDGVLQRVREILGPDGIQPSAMNDELRDLINPSIEARPLHLPESTRIREFKNKEYHYHWAFDRCGSNPKHERVEKLRGAGWDFATTKDVEMFSADTVKGKNKDGFSNEIRIGDLRLMKLPEMRWREIRKAQNLAALDQINPRRANKGPMSLESMTPGMKHYHVDDETIRAAAKNIDTPAMRDALKKQGATPEDLILAMASGNASVARVQQDTE